MNRLTVFLSFVYLPQVNGFAPSFPSCVQHSHQLHHGFRVGKHGEAIGSRILTTELASTSTDESSSSPAPPPKKIRGIKAEMMEFDLSGGRPGSIIESEDELVRKEEILEEIRNGTRNYPEWISEFEFGLRGEPEEEDDEPDAIDPNTIGDWTVLDLKSKFYHELDTEKGDADPNDLEPGVNYLKETPKDEDGIEIGWSAEYGPSNPIDERTVVGYLDSYVVDDRTRDVTKLTPQFHPDDVEIGLNEDIRMFRKSMDIIETYQDPYLSEDIEVPRHVAMWHGHPERLNYPEKPYENNRFTKEGDFTPFDEYPPHKARTLAVQYARSKNCEWLREDVCLEYHRKEREPYEKVGTLVGTLRKGHVDPKLKEEIEPALKILGSIVDLLSIEGEEQKIFRFVYHGLMKNKYGMSCWAQTLIRDCGVECDNVIFETGFRKRDPWYDHGDHWYGMY